jgi:hypothetical protein
MTASDTRRVGKCQGMSWEGIKTLLTATDAPRGPFCQWLSGLKEKGQADLDAYIKSCDSCLLNCRRKFVITK